MKLTEAQKKALVYIGDSPRKSGRFWRDLGIAPTIIGGLETMGLVGAPWRVLDATRIIDRQWTVTEAGRAALASEQKP